MAGLAYVVAIMMMFAAASVIAFNLMPGAKAMAVRGLEVQRVDVSRLPGMFKWLYPALDAFTPVFKLIRWKSYRDRAHTNLVRAGIGDVFTVDHLFGMKVIFAIVFPLFGSLVAEFFANPAVMVLVAIAGFYFPDRLVSDLRRAREKKIIRSLPGSVDVLSLSVEAGLEFLIAIQRLVERGTPGPLRDELATILNDIRLGSSRADALKAFAARVEIPEVSSFVSVLVQADQLGASIGPVLKQQGERMRVERFQRAEQEGAKASQKILFPLVFFIFPAVLIVIIGPVVLQFLYNR